MFEVLSTAEGWISLVSLSAMEIVLGIDNVIFISILSSKLPAEQQSKGRKIGLMVALVTRLGLLGAISWMMRLTEPLFSLGSFQFSGRDLILLVGGFFLVGKATYEIHEKLEVQAPHETAQRRAAKFAAVIFQIMLLDIVFSLDSVITAVGMAPALSIMVIAMVVAVGVMVAFANPIARFVDRHPTVKILALSFLILIGVMLVAEGMGQHVSKGYIYVAMAFSLAVELINLRVRKAQSHPLHLHGPYGSDPAPMQDGAPSTLSSDSPTQR